MGNEPDLAELRRDVRRCIACAKIVEFEFQAFRLGDVVKVKLLAPAVAADLLLDCAVANGLLREHGTDEIQKIISRGLNCEVAP
jgi:hypothetical protein